MNTSSAPRVRPLCAVWEFSDQSLKQNKQSVQEVYRDGGPYGEERMLSDRNPPAERVPHSFVCCMFFNS